LCSLLLSSVFFDPLTFAGFLLFFFFAATVFGFVARRGSGAFYPMVHCLCQALAQGTCCCAVNVNLPMYCLSPAPCPLRESESVIVAGHWQCVIGRVGLGNYCYVRLSLGSTSCACCNSWSDSSCVAAAGLGTGVCAPVPGSRLGALVLALATLPIRERSDAYAHLCCGWGGSCARAAGVAHTSCKTQQKTMCPGRSAGGLDLGCPCCYEFVMCGPCFVLLGRVLLVCLLDQWGLLLVFLVVVLMLMLLGV
jgi:hypothetical protein